MQEGKRKMCEVKSGGLDMNLEKRSRNAVHVKTTTQWRHHYRNFVYGVLRIQFGYVLLNRNAFTKRKGFYSKHS